MASLYWSLALLYVCVLLVYGYTPFLYYLSDECNFNVPFSKDMRLKLTKYSSTLLHRNWKCSATFRTKTSGDNLLVRIRSFDTDWSTHCRRNNLTILDSDKTTVLNGQFGSCGSTPTLRSFTTSGYSVTFRFQTDSSFQYGQFHILVTSFNLGFNRQIRMETKVLQTYTCQNGRFHCKNNRCINNDLVCNGYNDCGDSSDETCPLSAGIIVGIVVGTLVIVMLCVTLHVVGRRHKRRYNRFFETKPNDGCHTTTTTTYTQASMNPGPGIQLPYRQPSYQSYNR